ncbi:hypothetical protein [Tahibacter caeni]|uniref:hypothetical protein n=1 Tax=Tahibacter caeni TaxID=1453545 RepID=UPI002147906B|nr:hypothetical protein [Tahibacter caeni]
MPAYFHPRLQESRRVAANRLRRLARQWPQTVFHLVAGAALLALVGVGVLHVDGDRIGLVLRLLAEQPAFIGLAFAVFGFAMCRNATLDLLQELHLGWWGAAPVPPEATRRSLHLHALLQTALGNLIVFLVLACVVALSRHPATWFLPLLAAASVGFWLGSGAGYLVVRRIGRQRRDKLVQQHVSTPLVKLAALDHARLPHLADWQRRETLRRWRSGGRNWQFLLLGLLFPTGMLPWQAIGLLLLCVALIWYGLALRSSEDVMVRATQLFAALPLPFPRFAAGTLRYPLFAWLCASLLGAAGLLLQSAKLVVVLGYAAAIGLGSLLSLCLSWRYRHRPGVARVRATAEVLLVALIAYQLPPFAPLLALGLAARHYLVARSLA